MGLFDGTAGTARIVGLNLITGAITYDQQWSTNRFRRRPGHGRHGHVCAAHTTGVVKHHARDRPAFDTSGPRPRTGYDRPLVYSTPVYDNGQVFEVKGYLHGPESLYAINALPAR